MMTRRLWILSFAAGAWVLLIAPAVVSVLTHKVLQARAVPVVIERSPCPPSRAELGPEPLGVIVRLAGENRYEIDRLTFESLRDMRRLSRSARIVPEARDGKAAGFRLYHVHPDGAPARLGFQIGDVISSINGLEITTPEKALELYARLKSARHLSVGLERDGQRMNKLTPTGGATAPSPSRRGHCLGWTRLNQLPESSFISASMP